MTWGEAESLPIAEFNKRAILIEVVEAKEQMALMAIISQTMTGEVEKRKELHELMHEKLTWIDTPPPMPDGPLDPDLLRKQEFRAFKARAEAIAHSVGRGH